MNRITIFEKNGFAVYVREHLTRHPSGNAHARKKALKSGWKPDWVAEGKPMIFTMDLLKPFEEERVIFDGLDLTKPEPEVHYVSEDFEV